MDAAQSPLSPLILTVPGLDGSGPAHWQSVWERTRSDTFRVELGQWARPHRNSWISRLDHAVRQTKRPVVLAAHSLGCIAVAWWASLVEDTAPVIGALLVAPADVDCDGASQRIAPFAPIPDGPLPFPSILVSSADDPWICGHRAAELAGRWRSDLVDVGTLGHINAESDLGEWTEGQALLDRLITPSGLVSWHGPKSPGERAVPMPSSLSYPPSISSRT